MAELKTKVSDVSVNDFLAEVEDPVRRVDGIALRALMERVAGEAAAMWGPTIIGFGSYHYKYASGHEGDMCRIGFSPRKAELVLYVGGYADYAGDLARLGKHKTSKACLYVKKLADIDMTVLEDIARRSFENTTDHCTVC